MDNYLTGSGDTRPAAESKAETNGHALNGHQSPILRPVPKGKPKWLKGAGRQADVIAWAIHDMAAAEEIYRYKWPLTDPKIRVIFDAARDIYRDSECEPYTPEAISDHLKKKAEEASWESEHKVLRSAASAVVKIGPPQKAGDTRREVKRLRHELGAVPESQIFALNDIGNGKRFADKYSHKLKYISSREEWMCYSNGKWQRDEAGEHEQLAKTIEADVIAEAMTERDDDRRRQLLKHAANLTKRPAREKMLKDAATESDVPAMPEDFDAHPRLFNVANGTLDLERLEFRPHCAGDLLTLQSPIYFDPNTTCPIWRNCLTRWIADPETRDYIQESVGVTLDGESVDEFFNFLLGDGDNGKSTCLRTLEKLLGPYWQKTQAETIMTARDLRRAGAPSPELLALKGARLVTVHEIDGHHTLNAPLIKDLTGRDAITARGLFEKRPTTFIPQFTLWMFGNGKPQIKDTSGGMWRRVRLIDFGQPIPRHERDTRLGAKLEAELPGILNWALEGLRRVQQRGLVVPDAVSLVVADYRSEQDSVAAFIADCCTTANPQATTTAKALWETWVKWCQENGEKEGTQRSFGSELTRRKFERYQSNGQRKWRGIGIVEGRTLSTPSDAKSV